MSEAMKFLPVGLPGVRSATLVGSRVTCCPAPTDTDQDVLVLVAPETVEATRQYLEDCEFEHDGSDLADLEDFENYDPDSVFKSYSRDDVNVVITWSEDFHRRFLAATSVAKKLNLLNKEDRIDLFQAVLYGNAVCGADCTGEVPDFLADLA